VSVTHSSLNLVADRDRLIDDDFDSLQYFA